MEKCGGGVYVRRCFTPGLTHRYDRLLRGDFVTGRLAREVRVTPSATRSRRLLEQGGAAAVDSNEVVAARPSYEAEAGGQEVGCIVGRKVMEAEILLAPRSEAKNSAGRQSTFTC